MANTKKRQISFLEPQEVEMLIAKTRRQGERRLRDRAILRVLFSTGMRISEALALQSADFKPEAGLPTTKELSIVGKGGWQRVVYFSPEALHAIFEYQACRGMEDDDPRLFPVKPRAVQKMIKKCAVRAGITKRVTPHIMRHSFACHLLGNGANLFQVQNFLGHRSITSTTEYLHLVNKELKELHEKIYGCDK